MTVAIAALISAHNFALPLSFIPDPVVGLPAQAVTFGTNLGLKSVQAVFDTPSDWADRPNSADHCTYGFNLAQSLASYSNLLGLVNTQSVPAQWGDLTRFGPPVQVAHANTDVEVSVSGDPILANQRTSQQVRLPPGKHMLTWRAATQISDIFDIYIPLAFLGFNAGYYGAAFADQGASAARQLARQNAAREVITNIAIEAGLITADQLTDTGRTTVIHEREQAITIYDVDPPVIEKSQTQFAFEATDFGGVALSRVAPQLRETITVYDPCGRPFTLSNDAPRLLPIQAEPLKITWTVRDQGPAPNGGVNSASVEQFVTVRDTQPPILVAPEGFVRETAVAPPSAVALSPGELGMPLVVDLADLAPAISHDAPKNFPVNARTTVNWTAADDAGNADSKVQLITIKTQGTNTAPEVGNVAASAHTSEIVEIRLEGIDRDVLSANIRGAQVSLPDPVAFEVVDYPDHGELMAPLRPFFIEDFRLTPIGETEQKGVRTSPLGPDAEAFALLSPNEWQSWFETRYCQQGRTIPVNMVFRPTYVHVMDDGAYFVRDEFWNCNDPVLNQLTLNPRISKWDRNHNFIKHIDIRFIRLSGGAPRNTFTVDRDGMIRWFVDEASFGGSNFSLFQMDQNFENVEGQLVGVDEQEKIQFNYSFNNAHADPEHNVVYVHDNRGVRVYRYNDRTEVGRLTVNGEALFHPFSFPDCNWPQLGISPFWMTTDSTGHLYLAEACGQRIFKFEPSTLNAKGELKAGAFIGWIGRCSANVAPWSACDEELGISRGYSCDDTKCLRAEGLAGAEPGQFDLPAHLAMGPDDMLYVADYNNLRVQRFGPDGAFSGEAKSSGTGVNQGDSPGFVLGNMGNPRAIAVNSSSFYVMEWSQGSNDYFLHVFKTLPFWTIASQGGADDLDQDGYVDNATIVKYRSRFNFPGHLGSPTGVDRFTYRVSDGLAKSNLGMVTVDVTRSFRPPVALDQSVTTAEDRPMIITLQAKDPDGVVGFDGLDTLRYRIVDFPEHGQLNLASADAAMAAYRYQPDPDYFGEDQFTFIANDGRDDSQLATVALAVTYVDDPPQVTELRLPQRVGIGFPALMQGAFQDDGATDHFTTVNWGDGSPVEVEGDFVEDGDKAHLEGIKLVKPPAGNGTGRVIGQHVYISPGSRTVQLCIRDVQPRESCMEQPISPQRLVSLDLQIPEADAPALTAGQPLTIAVQVSNLEPNGAAGLAAQSVTLAGTFSGAPVIFTRSSTGSCQAATGNGGFNCSFGTFQVGEQRTITLHFATGALSQEADAVLRLKARTATPAINEVTETFTTRRINAGSGSGGIKTFANGVRFEPSAGRTLALMYAPSFGRAPVPSNDPSHSDSAGLLFWANQFLGGNGVIPAYNGDVGGIGEFFIHSSEFTAQVAAEFGPGTTVDDLSDAQFINLLYDNLLERSANAEERAFWSGRIAQFGRGSVLADIAFSDEFQNLMSLELVQAIDTFIRVIVASANSLTPGFELGDASIQAIADEWLRQYPQLDPVGALRSKVASANLPQPDNASAHWLIWSELPEALRALLTERQAVIRDVQQSADGQVIVFAAETVLLPGDDNDFSDIYRFEVASRRLQRLSVGRYGQSADAASHSPRLDGTGQRIVFLSAASNLTPGIPGGAEQLYLYDASLRTLTRLSETAGGQPADAAIAHPLIDAAGEQIIYRSAAHNLGNGPGLYLHDLLTGQPAPVAFDEWGQLDGEQADVPAADAGLALIAYQRSGVNGLGGESSYIYLYDREGQITERASPSFLAANGLPVSGCCASVSSDGRYLAYREAIVAGEQRLILIERASGHWVSEPWPQDEALAEQAPAFRNENRELWWIDPLQGAQRESVLHRVRNPLAVERAE